MKTGDLLPNGATVLEVEGKVILARNSKKLRHFEEYVTWKWDGTDPRSTAYGHYFLSLATAAKDFEERTKGEIA